MSAYGSRGTTFIHDEAAYQEATQRRIRENARKGKNARWLAGDASRADLVNRIGAEAEKGNSFMRSMYDAIEQWGALTEKQEAAARASFDRSDARRAAAKERDAGSAHVGTVGKRQNWTLTVRNVVMVEATDWSDAFRITIMADEAGNVIVYKGNSLKLEVFENGGTDGVYTDRRPVKGETIEIVATVKEHSERDGIKQTILNRPKLKAFC